MAINNISFETLENLLKKNSITQSDRFLIDSYVFTPLVTYCNDIRSNEEEKVHILEEKNLYRYLNATSVILGIYGREKLIKVLNTYPFLGVLEELKKEYSGKELEKMTIICMVKMLLALGGNSNNPITPIFEGEMPQKFMSFRNQTAKEWFGKFVTTKLYVLSSIYEKSSLEETRAHLLSSIAYQLHHSNSIKYNIDSRLSMDERLKNILIKFVKEQGGDSSIIYSNSGEVLSKVL